MVIHSYRLQSIQRILPIALIFCSSVVCNAQHMNATDAPCQEAGSGADETHCFVVASQQRGRELNHIYQDVLKVLAPDEAVQLRTAQRNWIQFRDSNCRAEKALYAGGSSAPMVYYACVEAETRYRIQDLKNTYQWRIDK
jgi:uncharacterized protein YecT (DUF1311 family)